MTNDLMDEEQSTGPGELRYGRPNGDFAAYDDLPSLPGTDEHYSWHVWGAGDQIGTMNRLTSETVLEARNSIVTGEVVSLSLPLDEPKPGLFEGREPYQRHEVRTNTGREDRINNLDLQFSSQWDGLRHIEHRIAGYYGGRDDAELDAGALGIQHLAARGIVARGVLLDVPAYYAATGRPYSADVRTALDPADVEGILAHQDVDLRYGDILVIRTGWIDWYLSLTDQKRASLRGTVRRGEGGIECAGLRGNIAMARWLWNSGLAGVASDNATVEALPVTREDGFLHRRVLPLLGMPFGELWSLRELSARCWAAGRYSFLLTSAPLNIPAGVASPANALAIL